MSVRIFWVCVMKYMCAQTRPQFILSSERVFLGMEFEPMLSPKEKSPFAENFPRGGLNPRRCGQRAQTLPTSYSGPWIRMIIIINLIYIAQFDTYGILTALYIVIVYVQMQYVHVWTCMKQSYPFTYICLHINTYTVTCTNIYLPTY